MDGFKPVDLAYDVVSPATDADDALSPIILLHGITSSRLTWRDIQRDIADITKRKVYALDARNHGESPWTDEFNYDLMVKDLEHFMQERGITKAIFIGHSMGGKTAMSLALSQPDKVEKLIVEDMTPVGFPPSNRNILADYCKMLRDALNFVDETMDLDSARKIISQFLISKLPVEYKSGKSEEILNSTLPIKRLEDGNIAWQANIDVLEDVVVNTSDLRKSLGGLYEGDVLFIHGTKSLLKIEKDRDDILKLFPKSAFIPVAEASHNIHPEFPEEYLKIILDFI